MKMRRKHSIEGIMHDAQVVSTAEICSVETIHIRAT